MMRLSLHALLLPGSKIKNLALFRWRYEPNSTATFFLQEKSCLITNNSPCLDSTEQFFRESAAAAAMMTENQINVVVYSQNSRCVCVCLHFPHTHISNAYLIPTCACETIIEDIWTKMRSLSQRAAASLNNMLLRIFCSSSRSITDAGFSHVFFNRIQNLCRV